MSPRLKTRYEEIHDGLSTVIQDVPLGALALVNCPSPSTPDDRPESLVHQTVRDGWLGAKTPRMMRDVMESVHGVIVNSQPGVIWSGAVSEFVKMVKTACDVLTPKSGTQVNVSSSVILDTLRERRM